MTIDFRPPEEQGHAASAPADPATPGAANQRRVLAAIRLAGVLCVVLGVAAVVFQPAFLGEGMGWFMGIALIVTGVFDFVAAAVLKTVWRRLPTHAP